MPNEREINNIPRGPQGPPKYPQHSWSKHKTRQAVRSCLAIQITLLITEIWEEICDEGFDVDSSESLVELFVKHGLAEKVEVDPNDNEWDADYMHRLRLDMAAVRSKVIEKRKKDGIGRK